MPFSCIALVRLLRPWRTGITTGRLAPKSSMTKNSGGFLRMEQFVGVGEVADFDAVDLVHGEAGEIAELAGDRIALDAGEHDDVLVFFKQPLGHVVGVEAAHGDVFELGGGEEIGVQRLENEPGEDDVAGLFLILRRHTCATSGAA